MIVAAHGGDMLDLQFADSRLVVVTAPSSFLNCGGMSALRKASTDCLIRADFGSSWEVISCGSTTHT